jgi:hypothetical protein
LKRTVRDNFRVQVTGTITLPAVPDAEEICLTVSGDIEPRRLGDLGFASISDSMVSRNIEADYERRCREIAAALREQQPHLKAEVVCDTREECSHCFREWEVWTAEEADHWPDEPYVVGEPLCCDKATDEYLAARKSVTETV